MTVLDSQDTGNCNICGTRCHADDGTPPGSVKEWTLYRIQERKICRFTVVGLPSGGTVTIVGLKFGRPIQLTTVVCAECFKARLSKITTARERVKNVSLRLENSYYFHCLYCSRLLRCWHGEAIYFLTMTTICLSALFVRCLQLSLESCVFSRVSQQRLILSTHCTPR